MLIKDLLEQVEKIRPANGVDTDLIQQWINEIDAQIQIEICHKKKYDKLIPDKWENKQYKQGDRVSIKLSGDMHIYKAKNDILSDKLPSNDKDNWEEQKYETYVYFPYDKLYPLYAVAMIDYTNQEYDKYANDIQVYNSALKEFATYWQRTYRNTWKEGLDEYKI